MVLKKVSVCILRHPFATHFPENGSDIRAIQLLLGRASLRTNMIYTHVAHKTLMEVRSPLYNRSREIAKNIFYWSMNRPPVSLGEIDSQDQANGGTWSVNGGSDNFGA